ncbi:MAG: winged helix-turn-helix domain-containing protein [Proteobacteria bacterium]|nr:winged helix-turn-helix domain-containing protein [Pseudomonadota bacterium]
MARYETLIRIQEQGPISFDDLAEKVGIPTAEVEKYVNAFSKKGLVVEAERQLSATINQ